MPNETTAQASAAGVEVDPIVTGSLSWPLTVASVLLILTTLWAAYDEFIGRRPWTQYQAKFVPAYEQALQEVAAVQRKKEKEIEADDEYVRLKAAYVAIVNEVKPERDKLNARLALVGGQMAATTMELKEARSYTAATIYKIETASSTERKKSLRAHLADYHKGPFDVKLPDDSGNEKTRTFTYEQLLGIFNEMKDEKGELRSKLGALVRKEAAKKKLMDAYLTERLDGPMSARIRDRIGGLSKFKSDITSHQIHIKEVGLVDRCEVCHLAIRSSVDVKAEDMRKADSTITESMARAFTRHPDIGTSRGDLLKIHDPDGFGCTPCHGGNGRALTSVKEAHGRYKHWLYPMHDKENVEAGCVQCHEGALHLEGAPTLNRGRYLFGQLGCSACHQRKGYDTEIAALKNAAQDGSLLAKRRAGLRKELMALEASYEAGGDDEFDDDPDALDDEEPGTQEPVVDLNQPFDILKLKLSQVDVEEEQLHLRKLGFERARKRSGPSLKEARNKLKSEWIALWLKDPRAFRPSTRMPHFSLDKAPTLLHKTTGGKVEQAEAIAAFLWQEAGDKSAGKPAEHKRGDPSKGKKTFETRGCMACHRVGDDPRDETFAADLSRVGEKVNYNYLVEWINNPPDWAIMPNLRLSEDEARDTAAYLMDQKTDAAYEPAAYIEDKSLVVQGKDLVTHYACFGCHEIAGMEDFGKIGTDLTKAGSKPIERLDFALATHEAKVDGWYNHKGFFDKKLSEPRTFDEGKLKLDWHENLKMPDFGLKDRPEDRVALTTFLLGSVDSQLPDYYSYDQDRQAKDVEKGWWTVKKYHCLACHQVETEKTPDLWKLSQYQNDGRAKTPPGLVGAGARLNAEWLSGFLRNPALSDTKTARNGVRMYLDIRMPTFSMSEEEIGGLVRFFGALSNQPSPYPHEDLGPLSKDELADVRLIFARSKCLNCHVTSDDPSTFTSETKAPGYLESARRLKPQWNRLWLREPDKVMPGTTMPPLFTRRGGLWKSAVMPDSMAKVKDSDHVELLVRYMKFFDEAEAEVQDRLQKTEQE